MIQILTVFPDNGAKFPNKIPQTKIMLKKKLKKEDKC